MKSNGVIAWHQTNIAQSGRLSQYQDDRRGANAGLWDQRANFRRQAFVLRNCIHRSLPLKPSFCSLEAVLTITATFEQPTQQARNNNRRCISVAWGTSLLSKNGYVPNQICIAASTLPNLYPQRTLLHTVCCFTSGTVSELASAYCPHIAAGGLDWLGIPGCICLFHTAVPVAWHMLAPRYIPLPLPPGGESSYPW